MTESLSTSSKRLQLQQDYEDTLWACLGGLVGERLGQLVDIARLPEAIRGYGHLRESSQAEYAARWAKAVDDYRRNSRAAGH